MSRGRGRETQWVIQLLHCTEITHHHEEVCMRFEDGDSEVPDGGDGEVADEAIGQVEGCMGVERKAALDPLVET